MFSAVVIDKNDAGQSVAVQQIDEDRLMEGDVTIDVAYSTLNYKDGLAITGKGAGGTQVSYGAGNRPCRAPSASPVACRLEGWRHRRAQRLGCRRDALGRPSAQVARLKGDWLVSLPSAFTAEAGDGDRDGGIHRRAVRRGTGFKAGVEPGQGRGPGDRRDRRRRQRSRSRCWQEGSASPLSRRPARRPRAITSEDSSAPTSIDRPCGTQRRRASRSRRSAGPAVVDSVGSNTLANAGRCRPNMAASVAACGLAQGADFPSSVMPFILRGVSLLGSRQRDGAEGQAPGRRGSGWRTISTRRCSTRSLPKSASRTRVRSAAAADLIDGKVRGRVRGRREPLTQTTGAS